MNKRTVPFNYRDAARAILCILIWRISDSCARGGIDGRDEIYERYVTAQCISATITTATLYRSVIPDLIKHGGGIARNRKLYLQSLLSRFMCDLEMIRGISATDWTVVNDQCRVWVVNKGGMIVGEAQEQKILLDPRNRAVTTSLLMSALGNLYPDPEDRPMKEKPSVMRVIPPSHHIHQTIRSSVPSDVFRTKRLAI